MAALGAGKLNAMSFHRSLLVFTLLAGLQPDVLSQVPVQRVPIEYAGVVVSIEMPKRWVDAPFPIQPVPANLIPAMERSKEHAVWRKDWSWNRSWFRGPLGHMMFDALLNYEPFPVSAHQEESTAIKRGWNFLKPTELLSYIQAAHARVIEAEFLEYSLVNHRSLIWVRQLRRNKSFDGHPRSETWLLGLTSEIFLRFDFACTPDAAGETGDRWLAAALYWQNRMINSIQVTGLKQHLTGEEKITGWKFPEFLKEDPDFVR